MKISSSVVDKTIKAWTFIIWISVSHTIAVNQEIADAVDQINSTYSNNGTELQEGSNSLVPIVIPQYITGKKSLSHNSTMSPEPTTKLKQTLPTDATFKPNNETNSILLPINKSSDPFTTLRVTPSSSVQPEVVTQRKERNLPTTTTAAAATTTATTTTTDVPTTTLTTTTIAPPTSTKAIETTITNKDTTLTIVTKLKSTDTTTLLLNASTSSNTTITRRQTTSTSDITSWSTSGSMSSSSSSSPLSSKSVSKSTAQSVSNSKSNGTTYSEYVTVTKTTNNSTELLSNTTDESRLTHTLADDFQSSDSFWPIALALTISIPTIVVLAITIAVLYRRRIAKPRSLLSMYGQF